MKRHVESRLTIGNQIAQTLVCLLGFAETGVLAHGPGPLAVHMFVHTTCERKLALGANVRVLRWAVVGQDDPYNVGLTDDDLSKVSFSFDLAATYSLGELFGLGQFSTGVYVKDAIMPNISKSGNDGGKLPIEVGVGVMTKKESVTVEGDVAFINGNTIFRGGIESGITGSALTIRAGIIYGSDFKDETEQTDFDLGIGYTFKSVIFDYAYTLPIVLKDTGGRHFVSFGLPF